MGGIIWLASYPKSGNTWARLFLHNLLLNPDKPADINNIPELSLADGVKANYEQVGGKKFSEYSPRDVAALIPKVHELFTKTSPDSVFVKTHTNLGTVFGVPLITPKYTIAAIYFIRNPLDVVVSFARHSDFTIDKTIELLNHPKGRSRTKNEGESEEDFGFVETVYGSWSGHVSSWMQFSRQHLHIMRYEDMLETPMETFGNMSKFLGLNPPEERLKKAVEFSSFDELKKQEKNKGFSERLSTTDSFFRSGKAGQWQEILSDKQVDEIVTCHRDIMKEFGYLPQ
jgi:Sulfotransferase domain